MENLEKHSFEVSRDSEALDLHGQNKAEQSFTILDTIGNTPMIPLEVPKDDREKGGENLQDAKIWAKLEYLNPSGSIKARIAKYMVEKAEEAGLLNPGDTIVEATSGNTGNALSMVAAVKGYNMQVVMPEGYSNERTAISKAFGADILNVGNFHVNEALEKARELGEQDGWYNPAQFDNEWNVEENRKILGQEILEQLPEGVKPDALVMGVGTGGTLIGVGQALREVNPDVEIYAVEPDESCTLACGEIGKHLVEGISDGFVPGIYERHAGEVTGVLPAKGDDSVAEAKRLSREHGLFVGPSSGANMVAVRGLMKANPNLKNVVTIFADEGEKYLSGAFAPEENSSK